MPTDKLASPVKFQSSCEIGLLASEAELLMNALIGIFGNAKDSSSALCNGSREMHDSASSVLHDTPTPSDIAATQNKRPDFRQAFVVCRYRWRNTDYLAGAPLSRIRTHTTI